MALNIEQQDINVLKQPYITKYLRMYILNFSYNKVAEISGDLTAFNCTIDANSDIRRTCSVSVVVTDSSYDIEAGNKIWLDKYIQPYVGYQNLYTGEIQWYNQGIYLINAPSWQYDAETNTLQFSGVDLMAKLTGLRNGYLEGITHSIPSGSSVRDSIIATLQLAGFNKYIVSECKDKQGNIITVPYDIEVDQGSTVYNLLEKLRDIYPSYEMFFDINGNFVYQSIPTGKNAPVLVDDTLWKNLVISEQISTDFESVKNYVEVYGATHDTPDYVATSATVTTSGTSAYITPTFGTTPTLTDGIWIGVTIPSAITGMDNVYITISGTSTEVYDAYGELADMTANTFYLFKYVANTGWMFVGHLQASGKAYDNNPLSPFYVSGTVGQIRSVLYGGDYENIQTDSLALQQAQYSLWQSTRLQDSITLSAIPNPWLDVNIVVSHAIKGESDETRYIVKSISTDYGTVDGTQIVSAITYYPLYPDI